MKVKWRVKEVAQSRGIRTASELAERADVNKNTAGALWNGRSLRVDRDTLAKLCYALNCAIGDLLEYRGNLDAGDILEDDMRKPTMEAEFALAP